MPLSNKLCNLAGMATATVAVLGTVALLVAILVVLFIIVF